MGIKIEFVYRNTLIVLPLYVILNTASCTHLPLYIQIALSVVAFIVGASGENIIRRIALILFILYVSTVEFVYAKNQLSFGISAGMFILTLVYLYIISYKEGKMHGFTLLLPKQRNWPSRDGTGNAITITEQIDPNHPNNIEL